MGKGTFEECCGRLEGKVMSLRQRIHSARSAEEAKGKQKKRVSAACLKYHRAVARGFVGKPLARCGPLPFPLGCTRGPERASLVQRDIPSFLPLSDQTPESCRRYEPFQASGGIPSSRWEQLCDLELASMASSTLPESISHSPKDS
ncbi:hypothetical protein CFRS1_v004599 [Colletotrichum fructicola]|nr:hypothetical protein CFRS1_v004599 [Colletotrichum fructicola]